MGNKKRKPAYVVTAPEELVAAATPRPAPTRKKQTQRIATLGAIWLTLMVVAAPWLFGSARPLFVFGAVIGFAFLLVIWWCSVALQGARVIRLPWNLLPLLGGIGLAIFQLVPLPATWLATLTPTQYELRQELGWLPQDASDDQAMIERRQAATVVSRIADDDSASENGTEASGSETAPPGDTASRSDLDPAVSSRDGHPLSLNPAGTRHDLTLLLIAASAFAASAVLLRRRSTFLVFATVCAINGVILAVFGIVQKATWNGKHFWTIPHEMGEPFASFVNVNNAGGYLNLCFACALGAVFSAFRQRSNTDDEYYEAAFGDSDLSAKAKIAKRVSTFLAQLNVWKLTVLVGAAVVFAGVFFTLSRGAILSCLIAAATTFGLLILSPRHKAMGWALLGLFGIALVFAFLLGDFESINEEIAGVESESYEDDDRLLLIRDVAPNWQDHWRFGSGLGTFRHIYRSYRTETHDQWFYHADNQYLEALIDGGFPALALILICVVWSFLQSAHLIRFAESSTDLAVGVMGAFALISQVVHAFFDFGLYIPANMILLAVICGATAIQSHRLVAARRASVSADRRQTIAIPALPGFAAWLVPLALFGGIVWVVRPAYRDVELSQALKQAVEVRSLEGEADAEEVERAITRLSEVVDLADTEAGYRELGDLYVLRYRLSMTERLIRNAENASLIVDPEAVYPLTGLTILHGHVQQSFREHGVPGLVNHRRDPLVATYLVAALEAYRNARLRCPLVATNHVRLAQLSFIYESPDKNQVHLDRAIRLAPGRADLLSQVGLLHAHAGRKQQALQHWRKSVTVSPEFQEAILIDASSLFTSGEIAVKLIPESIHVSIPLVERIRTSTRLVESRHPLIEAIENRVLEQLNEASDKDPTSISADQYVFWGQTLETRGQPRLAIERIERAVELYPDMAEPRYHLARIHFDLEEYERAIELVDGCLFLQPRNARFETLRQRISDAQLKAPRRTDPGPDT